jgi:predicted PurR-regulated permease PerM
MPPPDVQRTELHVPTSTILKLLLTALIVWAGLRLWPQLVLLFVACILAIAIEPAVDWLDRHGLSRGISVAIMAILLIAGLTVGAVLILPHFAEQLQEFVRRLPTLVHQIHDELTPKDPELRRWFDGAGLSLPSAPEAAGHLSSLFVVGQATLTGVMTTGIMLVFTFYLILDGRRLYAWLLAYVPRAHRPKMAETIPEVSRVIRAYVRGQAITSLLFSAFALVILTWFDVPAAVPLALFAGVCDVIPMIGIVIAILPAALLALASSKLNALLIAVIYLAYHQFENYIIAPRVYGHELRMSTLTVLLALLVGGSLFGLIGAILILPVVAAYPTIERIWLASYLGKHVIADHGALARAVESGDDTAVDTVLRAEKHPEERASELGS